MNSPHRGRADTTRTAVLELRQWRPATHSFSAIHRLQPNGNAYQLWGWTPRCLANNIECNNATEA